MELSEGVPDSLKRLPQQRFKGDAIPRGNADPAAIGLMQHFGFAPSAAMVGAANPEAANNQAEVVPDPIVHMSDSPEPDVEGARNTGMHAITSADP